MAVTSDELNKILLQTFPNAKIKIIDLAGDQDHYSIEIADKLFSELSLIKQHKMVKEALKPLLNTRLHAITIKTKIL